MVKRGKKTVIQINLSNRLLYTIIAIGILLIAGVGVYAWSDPTTGVGHGLDELEPCADDKILKVVSGAWACVDASAGSVTWSSITGIPPDIADGDQVGITSYTETDPRTQGWAKTDTGVVLAGGINLVGGENWHEACTFDEKPQIRRCSDKICICVTSGVSNPPYRWENVVTN